MFDVIFSFLFAEPAGCEEKLNKCSLVTNWVSSKKKNSDPEASY